MNRPNDRALNRLIVWGRHLKTSTHMTEMSRFRLVVESSEEEGDERGDDRHENLNDAAGIEASQWTSCVVTRINDAAECHRTL